MTLYWYGEHSNTHQDGFPGVSAVKNLPGNAGDPGLTPDLGRSTCWGETKPRHPTTMEPVFQSPGAATKDPHATITKSVCSRPGSAAQEATASEPMHCNQRAAPTCHN